MQALPVTFTPRPWKMGLLILVSVLFVALGAWIVKSDPTILGYAGIIFFGLGVIVGVVNLLPKSSYLTLTTEGFIYASIFRKHFVAWSNVKRFVPIRVKIPVIAPIGPVGILSQKMVGWNYRREFRRYSKWRKFNVMVSGAEAALPDTYGKSLEELCAILNDLHAKYGGAVERDGVRS